MSEEEAPFNAETCKKTSDVNYKRKRDEEEEQRTKDVDGFLVKLKACTRSACAAGKYKCCISFKGMISKELRSEINRHLAAKKFSYEWDDYDSDSFCVVKWGETT